LSSLSVLALAYLVSRYDFFLRWYSSLCMFLTKPKTAEVAAAAAAALTHKLFHVEMRQPFMCVLILHHKFPMFKDLGFPLSLSTKDPIHTRTNLEIGLQENTYTSKRQKVIDTKTFFISKKKKKPAVVECSLGFPFPNIVRGKDLWKSVENFLYSALLLSTEITSWNIMSYLFMWCLLSIGDTLQRPWRLAQKCFFGSIRNL